MTVESSSSSDQNRDAGPVVIALDDVGIWFRLHRKRRGSLRRMLIERSFVDAKGEVLWALRGVSLELKEGQTVGVVGRNGAGKSTLCLILAKILTPDEGEANIDGTVSALVTLGSGFNSELTGRDNIMLYGSFLGIPREVVQSRIDEIIEFSELGDFIDEPIRHYSSGMKARLGFSIASVLEPDILILDEVFAVGDREFRQKSRKRLEEMMEKSRLIIIVSHTVPFLRGIATHCLWLEKGRVEQFGPAGPVLDAYTAATGGTDVDKKADADDPHVE
jgi:ABC-type polysaccharide/polyol phosphate transport system ATPase subunit